MIARNAKMNGGHDYLKLWRLQSYAGDTVTSAYSTLYDPIELCAIGEYMH